VCGKRSGERHRGIAVTAKTDWGHGKKNIYLDRRNPRERKPCGEREKGPHKRKKEGKGKFSRKWGPCALLGKIKRAVRGKGVGSLSLRTDQKEDSGRQFDTCRKAKRQEKDRILAGK